MIMCLRLIANPRLIILNLIFFIITSIPVEAGCNYTNFRIIDGNGVDSKILDIRDCYRVDGLRVGKELTPYDCLTYSEARKLADKNSNVSAAYYPVGSTVIKVSYKSLEFFLEDVDGLSTTPSSYKVLHKDINSLQYDVYWGDYSKYTPTCKLPDYWCSYASYDPNPDFVYSLKLDYIPAKRTLVSERDRELLAITKHNSFKLKTCSKP